MRRACSSRRQLNPVYPRLADVSVAQSGPYRPRSRMRRSTPVGNEARRAAPRPRSPRAGRARPRRVGSISKKTTRSGRRRLRTTTSSRPRVEPRPGRHREPRELEHRLRLLPREEVDELVGTDEEQRIVEALRTEQVDRARIRVEAHVVVGERCARELEPHVGREVDVLVAGPLRHEHDEAREREALLRAFGERDVARMRRVERAAEQAYCHSSVSSPISTSSPSRAPAALRIASSSCPSGGRPVTRKPRSVRKTRYARSSGCGR